MYNIFISLKNKGSYGILGISPRMRGTHTHTSSVCRCDVNNLCSFPYEQSWGSLMLFFTFFCILCFSVSTKKTNILFFFLFLFLFLSSSFSLVLGKCGAVAVWQVLCLERRMHRRLKAVVENNQRLKNFSWKYVIKTRTYLVENCSGTQSIRIRTVNLSTLPLKCLSDKSTQTYLCCGAISLPSCHLNGTHESHPERLLPQDTVPQRSDTVT